MQHDTHPFTCLAASVQIANIPFDKFKIGPLRGRHLPLDFIKIMLIAGGKVVQSNYFLIKQQQCFQQVRADKPGATGHQPGTGLALQIGFQCFKCLTHALFSFYPIKGEYRLVLPLIRISGRTAHDRVCPRREWHQPPFPQIDDGKRPG